MFEHMNRLAALFILFFLLLSAVSISQTGYLFVKKGIKKKRIYTEGDEIQLRLQNGRLFSGHITLLRNDTLFVNGVPVHKTFVKEVLLKRKPKKPFPDAKAVALIAAGSALTSAGLAISDKEHKTEALIAGPVIGFGPLLIKHFGGRMIGAIPRKKFRIGKKFYLQVLDFHISPSASRLKSF